MKIGVIRHFAVDKPFLKGSATQSQVLQWFREYDTAPVRPQALQLENDWHRCYSSELSRAVQTAEAVFNGNIIRSALINEPVPSPLFQRDLKLPVLAWAFLLRLAILYNHSSQAHRRSVLEKRVDAFLTKILAEEQNVLVVGHAFTLELLSRKLRQLGWTGTKLKRPANGRLYVYEKRLG